MKRFLTFFTLTILAIYQFGCSSQDTQNRLENPVVQDTPGGISAAPIGDDVTLTNMYEDETGLLPDKARVQIVTVLEGTGRVAIEARYRGVRDLGFGFPVYECELLDQSVENMGGIAQGMSGSPVGPPGRVMGALAYGDAFSAAPTRFWVTAIDAMEETKTRLTLGDRLANDTALAAGDMIGVGIATGDVVNAIGFGTVTQVYDDGTFLAFGHPMTQAGKTAMPVYRAVVNGIVPNLQISYKSSYAYGDPIGTITKDLLPSIVGELGDAPDMIPVTVTYQLDSDATITKNHKVAYGQEGFIPVIAGLTFDALRQEVNFGTVEGTITLQFEETETTYTEKFYSASSDPFMEVLNYVGMAVASFTDITLNSAGKATINAVSITIKDSPKIRLATIHELVAPDTITPGETATFTVKLLPHWTGVENGRKIEKTVTLDIPADWTEDQYEFKVVSQYPDGPPSAFGSFFDFGFDEEVEVKLDPENLDELIERNSEGLVENPGLLTITLAPPEDFSFGDDLFDDFGLDDVFGFDDGDDDMEENVDMEVVADDTPSSVETTITIEDFIVIGTKSVNVDVAVAE